MSDANPIRYPASRWVVAVAGTLLQLCLGTVYAWSYFQKPLMAAYGWTNTQTAWAFSLAICFLGLSAAWGGMNLPRLGPRKMASLGAVLFGAGYLLAGFAFWSTAHPRLSCTLGDHSFVLRLNPLLLLYLGYGVIGGCGLGLGYVTPVATVAKWFPDRKGFVTGMVVMGFGLGALLMSKVFAPWLLSVTDGNLVKTFVLLGGFFMALCFGCAQMLKNPGDKPVTGPGKPAGLPHEAPRGEAATERCRLQVAGCRFADGKEDASAEVEAARRLDVAPKAFGVPADKNVRAPKEDRSLHEPLGVEEPCSRAGFLFSGQFLLMWLMFFANITAGIAIIAFQSPLLQDLHQKQSPGLAASTLAAYGATLIAVSSLFNGLGRFFWGGLSDRIGRVRVFRILLGSQVLAFLLLMHLQQPLLFSVVVCYILLCYGGGFGTMPSFVLDAFGPQAMARVYGSILTAWSAAGIVGPQMVAILKDRFGSQASYYAFGASCSLVLGGFVLSWFTREKISV